ncbi:cytochrome o ubiquinol oxidase operon protein cyoD [Roseateles sp. YR242]|uniref:cytochrome o ubiquinol oxidase subunit IV n=1 Tax=Roseateles sp. YR242 TaxID=1855305 RepID=UPI0008B6FBD4|nr:cytochrome o ubiquinol oxidase subunit IV [Roseateles sp. YR242]SEK94166.1 cytochrome o ubiquinol oxidase operon protein cyoD [Roseateles sp. YR242]
MSEHNNQHDHHDDHHDDDVGYHATVKGYLVGFILSIILTAIPFALVMGKGITSSSTLALVLLAFAAVQIVVHMIYFLHMNSKVEGGWSMLALIFTVAIVFIMLAGSVWVMFHLNANMMPVHDMRNMP